MLGREATAFDLRGRLLRHRAGAADRGRVRRHRRVLPRRGQVPPRRPPRLRRADHAGADPGGRREVPGLRKEADDRRAAPGGRCWPTGRRATGCPARPGSARSCSCPEIIGEIAGVGPKSKSVTAQVAALVERFGPGAVHPRRRAAGRPGRRRAVDRGGGDRPAAPRRRPPRGGLRRRIRDDPAVRPRRAGRGGAVRPAPSVPQAARGRVRTALPSAAGSALPQETPTGLADDRGSDHGSDGSAASSSGALDPEQHAIVTHDGGPLLVVAGPGAGKTRVLTHAIAHRIGTACRPSAAWRSRSPAAPATSSGSASPPCSARRPRLRSPSPPSTASAC